MTGRNEPIRSHTTSAGGVIIGPGGCIAVVSQKGRSWSLPKGGVNEGEDLYAAALREVWEETGLTRLDLVVPLCPYERSPRNSPNVVKRIVLYLFRTEETVLAPQDPDNPAAEWLPPREAAARLSHPRDREFLLGVIDEYGL